MTTNYGHPATFFVSVLRTLLHSIDRNWFSLNSLVPNVLGSTELDLFNFRLDVYHKDLNDPNQSIRSFFVMLNGERSDVYEVTELLK